jgi:S-adenosylmethionine decarboxylase
MCTLSTKKETPDLLYHLMFELYGCDRQRLENPDLLRTFLRDLPPLIDMTAVSPVHLYDIRECTDEDDNGLSGFVIIAQSHISLHAWGPYHELDVDICSCQPFDYDVAVRFAKELMGAQDVEVHTVDRATRSERDRKRADPAHSIVPPGELVAAASGRSPELAARGA